MGRTLISRDPRIARTKRMLMESLVELARHTSINCITVSQLTNKAKINRATFYRHFTGMPDFLNQLLDDVFENLQHPPTTTVFRNREAALTYYRQFFDSVKKHEDIFFSMLGRNGLPDFRQRFMEKRRPWHRNIVTAFRNEFKPDVEPELLVVSFIAVLLSLVEYWLHHNCAHTSEYMAEQLVRLTHDRVLATYGNGE